MMSICNISVSHREVIYKTILILQYTVLLVGEVSLKGNKFSSKQRDNRFQKYEDDWQHISNVLCDIGALYTHD